MLVRLIALVIGIVELAWPRRLVDRGLTLVLEDGDGATVRPWVYKLVRLEGAILVAWAVRRRRSGQH